MTTSQTIAVIALVLIGGYGFYRLGWPKAPASGESNAMPFSGGHDGPSQGGD